MMQTASHSPEDTKRIAHDTAHLVLKSGPSHAGGARVVALYGDLGAGKTTFVQGFAEALGVTDTVRSPTFLIMKSYQLSTPSHKLSALSPDRRAIEDPRQSRDHQLLYHIDCYRIHNEHDLLPLGIEELLADPKNIVLIEWAERVEDILPKERIIIRFEHGNNETERTIIIEKP